MVPISRWSPAQSPPSTLVFAGSVLLRATFAITLTALLQLPANGDEGDAIGYELQIRPLFKAKCVACHGGKEPKGNLRLDTRKGILAGGESGAVIVPGDAAASYLFELVHDRSMPPKESKQSLTTEEVERIGSWIAAGAKFPDLQSSTVVAYHDILPILLLRCATCHGGQKSEADLDLRTHESILRGGVSGPAIVAGKPLDSLLLRKIHAGEMPPKRRLVEASIKPIEPGEVERISRWIEQGAPTAPTPVEIKHSAVEVDSFWAFHPARKVDVPSVDVNGLNDVHPIDAFVSQSLQRIGLSLAESAGPLTLLRRAYIDLTGLPPTPEQIRDYEKCAAQNSNSAYIDLIERLLASPRYGERWGRYWLDVVGYSDSEGVQHADSIRANAWRYRDYVIRAFNDDKPYNRFLTEQIAGDELTDYRNAEVITDEIYDNLVATGFLRMTPDGTWANITNFVPDRLDIIGDEIEVLSSSVMGLTFKCARCHSHKFDPILQRNYFGLLAIFKGALDEHDWLKPYGATQFSSGPFGRRQLPFVTTTERDEWEAHEKKIQGQIDQLKMDQELQKKEITEAEFKELEAKTAKAIKALEAQRKAEPLVRALWDRGDPSPTYLLRRGNYLTAGDLVSPHVPDFLETTRPFHVDLPTGGATTGRRLAFARWLTQPDHPLTSRVLVNRLWKHHFGVGIVSTLDNFGKTGAEPTHPDLLDWLSIRFVKDGWSIKDFHRLIMTSATYRQSSHVTPKRQMLDPENRFLSRMPLRRLDAESLRDSLLFIAGRLDATPFGPPDPVTVREDGLVTSVGSKEGWRRSIYVLQRRTQLASILTNFDLPQMGPNCVTRIESTVAPQALHLLNNQMIHGLSQQFARRAIEQTDGGQVPDDEQLGRQIEWIYLTAYAEHATARQLRIGRQAVQELTSAWRDDLPADKKGEAYERALSNYCHAVMNSASLMYVD